MQEIHSRECRERSGHDLSVEPNLVPYNLLENIGPHVAILGQLFSLRELTEVGVSHVHPRVEVL